MVSSQEVEKQCMDFLQTWSVGRLWLSTKPIEFRPKRSKVMVIMAKKNINGLITVTRIILH